MQNLSRHHENSVRVSWELPVFKVYQHFSKCFVWIPVVRLFLALIRSTVTFTIQLFCWNWVQLQLITSSSSNSWLQLIPMTPNMLWLPPIKCFFWFIFIASNDSKSSVKWAEEFTNRAGSCRLGIRAWGSGGHPASLYPNATDPLNVW